MLTRMGKTRTGKPEGCVSRGLLWMNRSGFRLPIPGSGKAPGSKSQGDIASSGSSSSEAGRLQAPNRGRLELGVWRLGLAAFASLVPLAAAQPAPLPPEFSVPSLPTLSPWDTVFTFQSSAGYKDNVAMSATRPSGSPFVRNQADAIVSRLPVDGLEFNAFLSGEDTRYLASKVVDLEQNALAYAQLKKTWSELWSAGLAGQYIYLNQFMDLDDVNLARPGVLAAESHAYAARFSLRRSFADQWWWELEPGLARQDFSGPLDDYWERGAKVSLGRAYGNKSEMVLSHEVIHLPFDQGEQATRAGAAIPGSALAFTRHRAQLVWKHHWDELRHWRTTTKLGYDASHDNGPGYYDYRKWQLSQQARWAAAPWEASLTGRFVNYDFPHQPVAPGDPRSLERTDFNLSFHVERRLTKRVKWFLDYDFERSLANQPATGYTVNLVHSGLSVEF